VILVSRPVRVNGNLAYIQLTQNQTAVIDADDVALVCDRPWYANRNGSMGDYTSYACSGRAKDRPAVKMHRLITGAKVGQIVDHINGNGLDNRRCNLRVTDSFGNAKNHKVRCDSKSGVPGVNFRKDTEKWAVRIQSNGVRHFVGLFKDFASASAEYEKIALKLHGEFAKVGTKLARTRAHAHEDAA
jgi:hypothetical protein